MKDYYVRSGIGKARHVVNFHDGEKTHADGSKFYDIRILNNQRERDAFITELRRAGYEERTNG